jgi:hypothetical protein
MMPSAPGPALLIRAALLILIVAAAIATPADADLWGHLIFGRDILTAGRIVQQDAYSFTTDRPWVNHEWLGEVVLFKVYDFGGPAGLIALKALVIALLMSILARRLRRARVDPLLRDLLLAAAFIGTYWRTHTVRPQLFSVLLFGVLLALLTDIDERRRAPWLVPVIFAVWPNVHGGFIVGLGMLGIWVAINLIDREISIRSRLVLAIVGTSAVAATLLNPYGFGLWTFLADTVGLNRADIQDWGSIISDPLKLALPWVLTLAIACFVLYRTRMRVRISYVAMIAVLAVASARVSRIDAFFSIAVITLLAPQLAQAFALRTPIEPAPVERATLGATGLGERIVTVTLVGALAVPFAMFFGRYATCITIGGTWPPEAEAARFVTMNGLHGRMLTWFDWGQYAIWHFGPELKVSMDGRRETVYSDELLAEHWRFFAGDLAAQSLLPRLNPDYIWVPRRQPIASQLAARGWTAVFDGPVSLIFARNSPTGFRQPEPLRSDMRCFPGP